MIQAPPRPLNTKPPPLQQFRNSLRNFWTPFIRILHLIVMLWKIRKVINNIHFLRDVDLDFVGASLPVRGDDEDCFGFDLGGDFVADGGHLSDCWVVFHYGEVGPADAEEIDWHAGRGFGKCGFEHGVWGRMKYLCSCEWCGFAG